MPQASVHDRLVELEGAVDKLLTFVGTLEAKFEAKLAALVAPAPAVDPNAEADAATVGALVDKINAAIPADPAPATTEPAIPGDA